MLSSTYVCSEKKRRLHLQTDPYGIYGSNLMFSTTKTTADYYLVHVSIRNRVGVSISATSKHATPLIW